MIYKINQKKLPYNWCNYPAPEVLSILGDTFIAENKFYAMQVASSIVKTENNILINSRHKAHKKIKIISQESFKNGQ